MIATPSKPQLAAQQVGGHRLRERGRRREVVHRVERVADSTTPGTPASIAARNGSRSRLRSSARSSPTVAGPSSVDWSAAPRPGEVLDRAEHVLGAVGADAPSAKAATSSACVRVDARAERRAPPAAHVDDRAEHAVHAEPGQRRGASRRPPRPRRPRSGGRPGRRGRQVRERVELAALLAAITNGGTCRPRPRSPRASPASCPSWAEVACSSVRATTMPPRSSRRSRRKISAVEVGARGSRTGTAAPPCARAAGAGPARRRLRGAAGPAPPARARRRRRHDPRQERDALARARRRPGAGPCRGRSSPSPPPRTAPTTATRRNDRGRGQSRDAASASRAEAVVVAGDATATGDAGYRSPPCRPAPTPSS